MKTVRQKVWHSCRDLSGCQLLSEWEYNQHLSCKKFLNSKKCVHKNEWFCTASFFFSLLCRNFGSLCAGIYLVVCMVTNYFILLLFYCNLANTVLSAQCIVFCRHNQKTAFSRQCDCIDYFTMRYQLRYTYTHHTVCWM